MNLLFIHQNFPGQFRHVVKALVDSGEHRMVAISQTSAPGIAGLEPVLRHLRYAPLGVAGKACHPYLTTFERAVAAGQQAARLMIALRRQGFKPDVIVAHPGWGETLYAKDIYPGARLIHFCEFYYHAAGVDTGFDPSVPVTLDDQARIRTRNALHLLNLEQCDLGVSPTQWQRALHPAPYQPKLTVIHEGIDTDEATPLNDASFSLPDGRVLTRADPVITYVARNLEPYRGYPQFIDALAALQRSHRTVHALILGGDGVSYGRPPAGHTSWRSCLAERHELDPARTHHLGRISRRRYLDALRVGAAHVYLTYPFVLSWSMLEAMSCGCHVVGSDTPPVREVIENGVNGDLINFFDSQSLARRLHELVSALSPMAPLRARARQTVLDAYSHRAGTAGWIELIQAGP